MAISTEDRDYLVLMIDLRTCLANNDVALAESVRDAVNEMDPSDKIADVIEDLIKDENLIDRPGSVDAYQIIVNGVDCVRNREHKLTVMDAAKAYHSKDLSAISTWLDEKALESIDLDSEENPRVYIAFLIRLCAISRRYDKMQEIREKLKEVL
jgi:hypothetical protein